MKLSLSEEEGRKGEYNGGEGPRGRGRGVPSERVKNVFTLGPSYI